MNQSQPVLRANPTKLCKIATNCGMEVISTLRANNIPMIEAIAIAAIMYAWPCTPCPSTVARIAMAIPIIP